MATDGRRRTTSPTRFVVFTSPRSGSSWLVELLDGHPRIAAYAELFLPGDRSAPEYGSRDRDRFEATIGARGRRPAWLLPQRVRYLNRLFAAREGLEAIGFKLMYGHPEVHPGLLPYLAIHRARAIHLVRANLLDRLLSWESAVVRRQFRARAGDDVAEASVGIDAATLVARLADMESRVDAARRRLRRHRIPAHEVGYESLVASPQDELARAVAFLEVEPLNVEVASTLMRMNRAPRDELIENFDEVAAALDGTRFAWMLGAPATIGRP